MRRFGQPKCAPDTVPVTLAFSSFVSTMRTMGMLNDDLEPDVLQRLGAHMVGRLERSIDQANGQMVSVSGWLTAALFALNGGGALAALNAGPSLDAPLWSAGAFGVGLLFAMSSAVFIQYLISRGTVPAEALLAFWRRVEVTGTLDSHDYETLSRPIMAQQRWNWIAPALGWVSGIAFALGGTTLLIDVANCNPSLSKICARLQNDMLDPKQTGERSRALFTTVGCRFNG